MFTSIQNWQAPALVTISIYTFHRVKKWLDDGLPEERCGILAADSSGVVRKHFPIENIAHSTNRFLMNPDEQLQALLWMEKNLVTQLVIYHSHPEGPAHLSETDLSEAYYPEAVYMLWHTKTDRWKVNLFWVHDHQQVEIPMKLG